MKELRLFCVTSRESGEAASPDFFAEKSMAKRLRDALPGGKEKWQVSKGPDHRLYKPKGE